MGREIEVKIPLTIEEYDFLNLLINSERTLEGVKISSKPEILFKKDEYYSRYDSLDARISAGEPNCIRLRTESKGNDEATSFFTLKRKTRENGIEINREDETEIQDPEILREFFLVAGYHKWFSKEKNAVSVYCNSSLFPEIDFHVELEKVNDLLYLEVEVTDEKFDAETVKKALSHFILQLKLDPEKKDSRSWVTILENK